MREVDVLYIIEHVGRELDVACAVRHYAEVRHGLSVEVVPVHLGAEYALSNLHPRVVAVPYAYRLSDSGTSQYLKRWPGCTVLNLAWEELFYTAYEHEKLPHDRFTQEYVLHHAWGDFHRDNLAKVGVPNEHVFVNGHPTYMLYREPYCRRAIGREELASRHGLDPAKRWVLFSENYGWAFYSESRIAELLRGGIARETIDELMQFCAESLDIVLGWLAKLALEHDVEVIVRPRPATLEADFVDVVQRAIGEPPANLHVLKLESVREWILASDTVVSSYSTTLIEAAVADRAAFMVMPLPIPANLEADWYRHVSMVTDPATFETACLRPDEVDGSERLGDWARATMLGRGDPLVGLADRLAELCAPSFAPPPLPPRSVFPRDYAGWRALARRDDGWLASALASPSRLRTRAADLASTLRAERRDSFLLATRDVPERFARYVDRQDLFDVVDVERITGEWGRLLGS